MTLHKSFRDVKKQISDFKIFLTILTLLLPGHLEYKAGLFHQLHVIRTYLGLSLFHELPCYSSPIKRQMRRAVLEKD